MVKKAKIPEKWRGEEKAAKGVQVAFDVGLEIQTVIRKEAIDENVSPSDRVRQILGLPVISRPKRPRLSISLSENDFAVLSQKYGLDTSSRVDIKRKAAEELVSYVRDNNK